MPDAAMNGMRLHAISPAQRSSQVETHAIYSSIRYAEMPNGRTGMAFSGVWHLSFVCVVETEIVPLPSSDVHCRRLKNEKATLSDG